MEKEEYDAKMAAREKQEKATGKKRGGKKPAEAKPGPADKDQVNSTDDESRIMPVSGGGFEQAYNARAAVDNESRLIVAVDLGRSFVKKPRGSHARLWTNVSGVLWTTRWSA